MLDFPASPADLQLYVADNGFTYQWQALLGLWVTPSTSGEVTGTGKIVLQNSPQLTGSPTSATPPPGSDDASIATTEFVRNVMPSVSVISFGADPTGVGDSTAAFETMLLTGIRCEVPAGTYRITRKLIVPDGVEMVGQGGGVDFDSRTKLLFTGTGTKEQVIPGAIATTVANPDVGAPYLADSGTRGDVYKTNDFSLPFSAAIILGRGSKLTSLGVYPNFDGVAGYAGSDGRLSDDWDVGVWGRNSEELILRDCNVMGHWRKAGLLISTQDLGDGRTPSNQLGHVEKCHFTGFVGVSLRTSIPSAGSWGFAGLDFVNCYMQGLSHRSARLATSSFLTTPFPSPSGCLEIDASPMRGVQFLNCTFLHRDDIAAFLAKGQEILFDGCYWEAKDVVVNGAWLADSNGSRMVATNATSGLQFLGNSQYGIDMSSAQATRGQQRGTYGERYTIAAAGVFDAGPHYDDDYAQRLFSTYIGYRLRHATDHWRIDTADASVSVFSVNNSGHTVSGLNYSLITAVVPIDSALSVPTPKLGGFCAITYNGGTVENGGFAQGSRSGIVFYDSGPGAFSCDKFAGGANFLTVGTDVTGTTGVAGSVTIGVISNNLRIENRSTGSTVFRCFFFG